MGSPYADLERPPLSAAGLRAALVRDGSLWREVTVVGETASTNADVAAAARGGGPEGLVLIAERQTAGRGRIGRGWLAPARAGFTFSVLLRPAPVPPARWGWLPLLAGVALADAVRQQSELQVRLKWPNDLLAPAGGKLAGVLAEVVGDAVVLGIGLNVTTRRDELAALPAATSLRIEGAADTDRDPLLRSILRALGERYGRWRAAGGGVLPDYVDRCTTIGRRVRLELPGGGAASGTATGVDGEGRLVVRDHTGREHAWAAGDVEHLR